MRNLWRVMISVVASGTLAAPVLAEDEAKKLIDRLLAPPVIRAESGFTAKVLVAPGQLYDPLFMLPRDGVMWLNDDGKEE